jgi:hypothetical protein
MTDDPLTAALAEQAASTRLAEALAEIKRLRERITELEVELAFARGTLAKPTSDDDQPTIVHNVPPNAPPHNE